MPKSSGKRPPIPPALDAILVAFVGKLSEGMELGKFGELAAALPDLAREIRTYEVRALIESIDPDDDIGTGLDVQEILEERVGMIERGDV